ncbi:conserved hypothetical protein [Ixodes scapularis]|uniref:Uncharacterized protein n=1 Tax=Ixodes scapularis TaxID=6945 RepID=B7Q5E2_IXOSC|nr:conserved hypothetical protein [Ixodes scapularis]|eukprot:XP_002411744.1 conserved hypothetical protein [Ixodes scapularis]
MKMTEVERETKLVVDSLVSMVSAGIEREHLATLLGSMSVARTLFHQTHTVYDANSQRTQQVVTDFMSGLSWEAMIIYSSEVCLADEVVDLATGTKSVVLMCITDCNYRFVTINVDAYGRQSEGGVLKQSAMGASLESGQLNLPGPRPLPGTRTLGMPVFLGDEAFQLRPDFLRPYPGKINSDDKIIFNN